MDLSSRNAGKYEFSVDEDISPEEGILEKFATIKIFEYSPLSSELKKQAEIAKKQYQRLNKVYEFYKKENDEATNKKV